jgi:hypothetical protein
VCVSVKGPYVCVFHCECKGSMRVCVSVSEFVSVYVQYACVCLCGCVSLDE